MAGGAKAEFPPLLPAGFHEMSLKDLRVLCVERFPLSRGRGALMNLVEEICSGLSAAKLRAEVWVDGSFLTAKIEPDDVDVVVCLNAAALAAPSLAQRAVLDRIAGQGHGHGAFNCDSYIHIDYDAGHARHGQGAWMRAYWTKQFGFSRSENMKGIAVVKIPLP